MARVFHPNFTHAWHDVPDADVGKWLAGGWLDSHKGETPETEDEPGTGDNLDEDDSDEQPSSPELP